MPLLRIILAVFIGVSLAFAPVAGAIAMPMAGMGHCDSKMDDAHKMGDCNCCHKSNTCNTDTCSVKCAKVSFTISSPSRSLAFLRQSYEAAVSQALAFHSWPPPAPPPRA